MNKISIRLTSFLLAIFSYVLIFQNIVSNQEQIPLNTNEQFEINIANTLITKEELALELDKIVDTNNATLIKIATPTNDYENKKDIYSFYLFCYYFCVNTANASENGILCFKRYNNCIIMERKRSTFTTFI